jgi:stearoyl-CoA desaturase (delta-9 desaturase)
MPSPYTALAPTVEETELPNPPVEAVDMESHFAKGFEPSVLGFMIVIHAIPAVLCAFFPSWPGVWMMVALYFLTGFGVTIGYHRKLTHHAFKSPRWVSRLLAVLGLLAGEGPPIFWVAHHRKHHRFSDVDGDPHSPREGFLWAHMVWLLPRHNRTKLGALYRKWAPDLVTDRFFMSLDGSYLLWHGALLVSLFAGGWFWGGWQMGMSFVAYGFFLRMLLVLHATWMVNSLSHMWGYRSYDTEDDSRNNALVGLLAQGEGWHNNHHHYQASANHGHRWWEVDVSFGVIYLLALTSWPLAWVGLGGYRPIYNLKFFSHKRQQIRTLFPGD